MITPHDLGHARWRKSRQSGANGNCVEVANLNANIGMRDSKAPHEGHLTLTPQAWATLIAQVQAGRYDQ